ncbi:MAG: hypothetical protein ISS31_09870 [Kiritimatiellae bacterium]|nr:hypothetical protein [Kiritimatiellia bacterium]
MTHLSRSAIMGLATLCTAALTAMGGDVTLTLDPARIYPGELATLQASMESSSYASFTLALPPDEHLLLVSREPGAVLLADGIYHQSHRWVVQAVSSGEVNWEGLYALVSTTQGMGGVAVAPATLTILPYPAHEESATPAPLPLPPSATASDTGRFIALVATIAVLCVALLAARRWRAQA